MCLSSRSDVTRLSRRFARKSLRKVQSGVIKQITFHSRVGDLLSVLAFPFLQSGKTCRSVYTSPMGKSWTQRVSPQGQGERAGGRRENSNKPGSREEKLASRRFAKRDPLIYASPAPTCDANNDAPPECIKKHHTTSQNELWSRFGKLFFCEFP